MIINSGLRRTDARIRPIYGAPRVGRFRVWLINRLSDVVAAVMPGSREAMCGVLLAAPNRPK